MYCTASTGWMHAGRFRLCILFCILVSDMLIIYADETPSAVMEKCIVAHRDVRTQPAGVCVCVRK